MKTTEPLTELVRSALPPATLRALRLVCRAARDDLVDGRCTALEARPRALSSPQPDVPATQALIGLAGRLRSLEALDARGCGSGDAAVRWRHQATVEGCDELAAALERLPNPSALTALDFGCIDVGRTRQGLRCSAHMGQAAVRRLAAALGRCRGLRALRFQLHGAPAANEHAAALLHPILRAARGLPALAALGAACTDAWHPGAWLGGAPPDAAALLPLRRLEALELRGDLAELLPALPRAARELPALRSLVVDAAGGFAADDGLAALWQRAKWLAQLTRLVLEGLDGETDDSVSIFAGLPDVAAPASSSSSSAAAAAQPLLLRSIRELFVEGTPSADDLRRLLGACNPATLEALAVHDCWDCGAAGALAERAGAFAALRRLPLDGREFLRSVANGRHDADCERPGASWRGLQDAPFAPLERLEVRAGGWLLSKPERLHALLSARWAASVAALTLYGDEGVRYLRNPGEISSKRRRSRRCRR